MGLIATNLSVSLGGAQTPEHNVEPWAVRRTGVVSWQGGTASVVLDPKTASDRTVFYASMREAWER
jgi:hypothetical protein